ncbi:hypothetical protein PABG_04976 [Paracoccidioides brasiliensis Pb03]|nr:hypothetical protein PABG_04976 [Paracoccidioides brasiliensis Pb03]
MDVFTFSASPAMPCHLSFSLPQTPPSLDQGRSKRPRPLTDVDGEGSMDLQNKKRRLRLVFVTSRLSLPFSAPPTHIIGRDSSKIAVWAKQKALGRNLLRKAAIMNRVRKHALSIHNNDPLQFDVARQLAVLLTHQNPLLSPTETAPFANAQARSDNFMWTAGICQKPSMRSPNLQNHHLPFPTKNPYNTNSSSSPSPSLRQYIPLPPPPQLDLTNYDIFDNEDGYFDSDSDGESEGNDGKSYRVYSDFNILEPSEPVVDDHDDIASFDSLIFGSQFLLTESVEDEESVGICLE